MRFLTVKGLSAVLYMLVQTCVITSGLLVFCLRYFADASRVNKPHSACRPARTACSNSIHRVFVFMLSLIVQSALE